MAQRVLSVLTGGMPCERTCGAGAAYYSASDFAEAPAHDLGSACELLQVVRPLLHHRPALGDVGCPAMRATVRGAHCVDELGLRVARLVATGKGALLRGCVFPCVTEYRQKR
jgi:hypothetical protein